MTMHTRLALIVLATAAALAGCGSDGGSKAESTAGGGSTPSAPSSESTVVKETDFKIDPKNLTLNDAGTVTLTVRNDGQATHALEIEGQGTEKKTGDIAPGESAKLTVTLKKGSYEWYCPIDGHRKLGMEGTLTVGGGTTTTDDSGGGGSDDSTTTQSGSNDGY
jgi:uncharacterized cupredoxin-like copper-binding protein